MEVDIFIIWIVEWATATTTDIPLKTCSIDCLWKTGSKGNKLCRTLLLLSLTLVIFPVALIFTTIPKNIPTSYLKTLPWSTHTTVGLTRNPRTGRSFRNYGHSTASRSSGSPKKLLPSTLNSCKPTLKPILLIPQPKKDSPTTNSPTASHKTSNSPHTTISNNTTSTTSLKTTLLNNLLAIRITSKPPSMALKEMMAETRTTTRGGKTNNMVSTNIGRKEKEDTIRKDRTRNTKNLKSKSKSPLRLLPNPNPSPPNSPYPKSNNSSIATLKRTLRNWLTLKLWQRFRKLKPGNVRKLK